MENHPSQNWKQNSQFHYFLLLLSYIVAIMITVQMQRCCFLIEHHILDTNAGKQQSYAAYLNKWILVKSTYPTCSSFFTLRSYNLCSFPLTLLFSSFRVRVSFHFPEWKWHEKLYFLSHTKDPRRVLLLLLFVSLLLLHHFLLGPVW